jgi:hypothetical protein
VARLAGSASREAAAAAAAAAAGGAGRTVSAPTDPDPGSTATEVAAELARVQVMGGFGSRWMAGVLVTSR